MPWYLNSLNSNSGDIDTSVTIGSGNFAQDSTTSEVVESETTSEAAAQTTTAGSTAAALPSPKVDADDVSAQSDNETTGWQALEPTAQYGIIGGAAGAGALLL